MTRVSRWLLYVGSSALAVQWAPLVVSAQITPGGVHSVIRPGALNDIPAGSCRHKICKRSRLGACAARR